MILGSGLLFLGHLYIVPLITRDTNNIPVVLRPLAQYFFSISRPVLNGSLVSTDIHCQQILWSYYPRQYHKFLQTRFAVLHDNSCY